MRGKTKCARALQFHSELLQRRLPFPVCRTSRNIDAVHHVCFIARRNSPAEIARPSCCNFRFHSAIHRALTKPEHEFVAIHLDGRCWWMSRFKARNSNVLRCQLRIAGHNCETLVVCLHARQLANCFFFSRRRTKLLLDDFDHFVGISISDNKQRCIARAVPLAVIVFEILLLHSVDACFSPDRVSLAIERTWRDALGDVIARALPRRKSATTLFLNNLALRLDFFWRQEQLEHHIGKEHHPLAKRFWLCVWKRKLKCCLLHIRKRILVTTKLHAK